MNIFIKKILITLFFLLSFSLTLIGTYIHNYYIFVIGIIFLSVSICVIIVYYISSDSPRNHKIIDDSIAYF